MNLQRISKKVASSDNLRAISLKYIGIALMFILQILLVKLSGVEQYGIYVSLLALCNILGTATAFGQLTFLTKNVAIKNTDENNLPTPPYVYQAVIIFVFCYLILMAVASLLNHIDINLPSEAYFFILILFIALLRLLSGAARGIGYALTELTHTNITKPIVQATSVIFLYLLARQYVNAADLIFALLLSNLVVILLIYLSISKNLAFKLATYKNAQRTEIFGQVQESAPFALLNVITALEKNIDLIIVSALLGAHSAGVYGFISRLYRLSNVAQSTLNIVFGSKAAKSFSDNNLTKLRALTKSVVLINTANAIFFLLFFVFASDYILKLIEPDLMLGKVPLIILLISAVIRSLCGPVSVTANMTGNQLDAVKITLTTIIAGSILIYFLTATYGLVGTACGVSTLSLSRAILLRTMLHHKLNQTNINSSLPL